MHFDILKQKKKQYDNFTREYENPKKSHKLFLKTFQRSSKKFHNIMFQIEEK